MAAATTAETAADGGIRARRPAGSSCQSVSPFLLMSSALTLELLQLSVRL